MPLDDLPDDLRRPLDESIPTLRPAVPTTPIDPAEPDPAESDPAEPNRAEPDPAEPNRAESDPAESDSAEPDPGQSDPAESSPPTDPVPAGAAPAAPAPEPEPVTTATRPPEMTPAARPGLRAVLVRRVLAPPRALVRMLRRAARAVAGWSRGPAGRFAVPGLVIIALVGMAGTAGTVLVPAIGAVGGSGSSPEPTAALPSVPQVGAVLPTAAPPQGPTAAPGLDGGLPGAARAEALRSWAEQVSRRTGVPLIALQAYGYAELVVAQTQPRCQLSWTTLAAIGKVESNHGSSGGATLQEDGRALPAIIGLPLDGQGNRALIADTDGGELDTDTQYDRAVGPMQFIPGTWRTEAVDASGDGLADVHNINDAALAAANYLCRAGGDLTSPNGWWTAVLAYNHVQPYADAVFAAANEYGQLSRA